MRRQPPRSPRAFHRQPFPRNGQSWDSRCRFFRCEDTSPKPFRHTVYLQHSQDRSFCLQHYYLIFSNGILHLRTAAFRPVSPPANIAFTGKLSSSGKTLRHTVPLFRRTRPAGKARYHAFRRRSRDSDLVFSYQDALCRPGIASAFRDAGPFRL